MSPAGFFAVVAMPFVGRLLGWGTDARWLITAGLLTMAVGNYWMSQMNLDMALQRGRRLLAPRREGVSSL